jgi:non-specific serine/threonine protein kinase
VGKTRLALRLASNAGEVWLVELAALSDARRVAQRVAEVLGIRECADQTWEERLVERLRTRRLLIVLDSCEHVVEGCAALVDRLLRACPEVNVLATSREPLGVAGEVVWRVAPLSVAGESSEAVRLFVARAGTRQAKFRLTDANAAAVVEICRRVGGLPLAIELVAARVHSLGVKQILARLSAQFALDMRGARAAPARQQTLRATLDWSYRLLSERERVLLRRLAVFVGGWTLDGAEAVCSDPEVLPLEVVAEVLDQLVTRSFMCQEPTQRYGMLDITRDYALELLSGDPEVEHVRRRHAEWCLALAERAAPEALDAAHAVRLQRERDNLRTAMTWALAGGHAELAMRLASATFPAWYFTGNYAEGRTWLERALDLPGSAPPAVVATARGFLGQFLAMQGEYAAAQAHLLAALDDQRARGNAAGIGLVLVVLANMARLRGDLVQARALHGEALPYVRQVGSELENAGTLNDELAEIGRTRPKPLATARALYLGGLMASHAGESESATELIEQALDLHRQIGDHLGSADSLIAYGHVLLDRSEQGLARLAFVEAAGLARDSGDRVRLFESLDGIARAVATARPEESVRLASAVGELRAEVGTLRWPSSRRVLETWLETARRALGDRTYRRGWDAGRSLREDEVVTLGLELGAATPLLAVSAVLGNMLTPREREVVGLVVRGLSTRQIAAQLVISPRTMRTHIGHILSKLGLHSRAQLVAWAVSNMAQ